MSYFWNGFGITLIFTSLMKIVLPGIIIGILMLFFVEGISAFNPCTSGKHVAGLLLGYEENLGNSRHPESTGLNDNKWYLDFDTLHIRGAGQMYVPFPDSIMLDLKGSENDRFIPPVYGRILSPFGYRGRQFHAGVDISLKEGDTVRCAFDGVVRMAKRYYGYGNCVVVRHTNGLETLYGHLSKINVSVNDTLQAGDLVGLGGHTGRASCNHLHFETFFLGKVFNPRQIIDFDAFSLIRDKLRVTSQLFGKAKDYMADYQDDNKALQLLEERESDSDNNAPGIKNSSLRNNIHSRNYSVKNVRSKAGLHKKTPLRYHTIRAGETLSAIARRNGTSVREICSLNGYKANKILKPGTRMRIK